MQAPAAPIALPVNVDTTGAKILENEASSPDQKDSRDIYLPNHVETVSHIAVDIGGSLAKAVYFTRAAKVTVSTSTDDPSVRSDNTQLPSPPQSSFNSDLSSSVELPATPPPFNPSRLHSRESSANQPRSPHPIPPSHPQTADGSAAVPAGTLTPTSLFPSKKLSASALHSHFMKRRSLPAQLPGGRLNFVKFETADIDSCLSFLKNLIESSAKANNVSLEQMRKGVKVMATGGGAHLYYELFERELGVEVQREDEMGCLITGLNFITLIPDEVFWYSDELVNNLASALPTDRTARKDPSSSASSSSSSSKSSSGLEQTSLQSLPRPSPDPPLYEPLFDSQPSPKLPCLLVNIGSGVSIIKVDDYGKFERVSGTSLGGGTLWGLLSLLTDADSFDEMLELASQGDNSAVDLLVSDVYGGSDALSSLGLKSSTIASSFGKVFRKDRGGAGEDDESSGSAKEKRKKKFKPEDICKSLLYAVSNNIGQIAYMNAEKFNLDRIYFSGCFIRGHRATIATLSYAIRFWSKGTKRAFFLRHEGYLGAVGAWIRHVYDGSSSSIAGVSTSISTSPTSPNPISGLPSPSFPLGSQGHRKSQSLSSRPENLPTPVVELREPFSEDGTTTSSTPLNGERTDEKCIATAATGTSYDASLPPMLAEALGGVSLDHATGHGNKTNGMLSPELLHQEDIVDSAEDESLAEGVDEKAANVPALLESLSPSDRALLGPLLADMSGGDDGDGVNVAQLLAKMEAANGAADGLEEKLDQLLNKLDGILEQGEDEGNRRGTLKSSGTTNFVSR